MLLHAFFLAAVQVLVYAGAVMVLFLFVIMLLDLKEEQRRKFKAFSVLPDLIAVVAIGVIFSARLMARLTAAGATVRPPWKARRSPLGKLLFTQYLLPFEIVSVLLLVAMVGVILLSKKELK